MKGQGIKTIEVNGGYIQIDLLSSGKKLADFARTTSILADSLESGEGEAVTTGICKKLAEEFEKIFGRGACKKTFGTNSPRILQFAEFWDKFEPLLNGWLKDMEA